MPFALLIVGIVLLVSAVRGTQGDLFTLVKGDFSGSNNYLYWVVSILIIGAVGYIDTLRPISRMFLVLVVVVLFLSHGGVFQQLNSQLFSPSTGTVTNDGLSLQQWLDSLTPQTNFGNEQPLVSARPQ